MSVSSTSTSQEESISCSSYDPSLKAETTLISPEQILATTRKINDFVSSLIPLSSDRCLKRYSGCLSCPPQGCVHSGGGQPLMELCHCWTCCFGKVHGKDIKELHLFLTELVKQHNINCIAETVIRNKIPLGTMMRQLGDLTKKQKEILKSDCKKFYELSLEEGKDKLNSARNHVISSQTQSQALHLILELWQTTKKTNAKNLPNIASLWIKNKQGDLSPFCSQRLEAFVSSQTFHSKLTPQRSLRASIRKVEHIVLQVRTTLSCIIDSDKYRSALLTTQMISSQTIYVCSTELLYCILVASLESEQKYPALRNKLLIQQFPAETSELIRSSSETFRKTLLGEFLLSKRTRKKEDGDDDPLEPKQRILKVRQFSKSVLSIKMSTSYNKEEEEDPDEGPSSQRE
ncbi:hypothetical protein [Chlamydiifrater volucris]|uniref:hypothetical protein n=1 Tax=Chlamydiifrater volucris TaxID=2681470 RepID=UPI001BCBC007|nr:hypothetical protein [Chlamydiifrater volucris]